MFYVAIGILALIAASGFARSRAYTAKCGKVHDADVVESRFVLQLGSPGSVWHTLVDSTSGQRATICASPVFAKAIAMLMNSGASASCMVFIDRDLADDMRNRQHGKENSHE